MRTIRVTGKGNIKVHPDTTRITITLTEVCREYGEALKRSSEDTEKLKELLSGFGFSRSDLKTLNFSADTEYEGYTENGAYKQRLVGYRYRHTMKVEFGSDNDRLGKALYALANSDLHPEFSISYTVKDREAAKNELLGKAVADAKEKAAVLTQAAGVTLKDIQTVDYSWGEIDMEFRATNSIAVRKISADCAAESYAMDIEPDDISVSDTVTVVWEIA
ncbi:MAG: SIMPL domain-containing protein [Clostridia bacterium]|nr:SIMPL domain-containing protein [Clostridia bacterium]